MKAYNLHGVGDLRFEEVTMPKIGHEENGDGSLTGTDLEKDREKKSGDGSRMGTVLVRVAACGICGSDIPRVYTNGTYHFPTIIGHEFSGKVAEVPADAPDEVKAWQGKRVGIFPLIPCMTCPRCRKQQYEMCEHYSYLGSREDGGMAEFVRVPVWNLIELPENVTFEQAAMLEPMSVAVHAIRRCLPEALDAGSDKSLRMAVCGMGTIGTFVAMFLRAFGYENVRELRRGDVPEENAFDVFFECVGTREALCEGLKAAAPGGRLQLVGNPAGDMNLPRDIYWKILRKQLTMTGTWNSSFTHSEDDDWHVVLDLLSQGKIHPEIYITHKFPMEDGGLLKGFELMHTKAEPYTKVMGVW